MKKYFNGVLFSAFILTVIGTITVLIIDKIYSNKRNRLYEKVKSNPRVYAYDTLNGVINPVFYFKLPDEYPIIRDYYNAKRRGGEGNLGFIRIRMLPYNKPLILIDSTSYDDYVQIAYFYDSSHNYYKGYLLKEFMHYTKANDSLLKIANRVYDSLK